MKDIPECPRGPDCGQGREGANANYASNRLGANGPEPLWGVQPMGDGTWICMECGYNFDDDGLYVAPLAVFEEEPLWRHTYGKTRRRGGHD